MADKPRIQPGNRRAEDIPLALVDPDPHNYNDHPPEQVAMIARSLDEFGQAKPVVVQATAGGRYTLAAGHGVALGAQRLGWATVWATVIPAEWGRERVRAYLVADNRTAEFGQHNDAALAALLQEIAAYDAELLPATGYTGDEADELVKRVLAGEDDREQVEDYPTSDLQAPFPYFGGKRAIAGAVWARFGQVDNYVEPFFGSGAMLLSRPVVGGVETVNDLDGFIANFWRAVGADPEGVARFVDWPTNENDLLARHIWLVNQRQALTERLHADPDYYDAKIAGWWCWGACNWIGGGWCSGDGPWQLEDGKVTKGNAGRGVNRQIPHVNNAGRGVNRQIPHVGDAGQGVNRQIPHVGDAGRGVKSQIPHVGNAGQGVNRKIPHVGDAGRGVNRKIPHVGDAGQGVNRQIPHVGDAGRGDGTGGQCAIWAEHLAGMMQALSDRLRRVRVACGDWQRVVTSAVTDRHGLTAVFLDPPYGEGAMEYSAGGNADENITRAVQEWAIRNGENELLRIAICGYDPLPLAMPAGWRALRWSARKGYAQGENAENRHREIVWFSPHCEIPEEATP